MSRQHPIHQWKAAVDNFDHRSVPRTGEFGRWLVWHLQNSRSASERYKCAYMTVFSDSPSISSALLSRVRDQKEHYLVRGQCLEHLPARINWYRPRNRKDRKVYQAVLKSLTDPHANVRFWACYAAGSLRMLAAQEILRKLVDDEGLGDMGWTVGYEAIEALKSIRGEPAWDDNRRPEESPYPPL